MKWLLENCFELHIKMIFKEAIQHQCQSDAADEYLVSVSMFYDEVRSLKIFIKNISKTVLTASWDCFGLCCWAE